MVVIEEESEKENNVDNFSECRLLSVLQQGMGGDNEGGGWRRGESSSQDEM